MGNNNNKQKNKQKNKLNEQAELQHVIILTKMYDLIKIPYNIFIFKIDKIIELFGDNGFNNEKDKFKNNWETEVLANLKIQSGYISNFYVIKEYIDKNIDTDTYTSDFTIYKMKSLIKILKNEFKTNLYNKLFSSNLFENENKLSPENKSKQDEQDKYYLSYLENLKNFTDENFRTLLFNKLKIIFRFIELQYDCYLDKFSYVKLKQNKNETETTFESVVSDFGNEVKKYASYSTIFDLNSSCNKFINALKNINKKYLAEFEYKKHRNEITQINYCFENIVNYIENSQDYLYYFYLQNYKKYINSEFFDILHNKLRTLKNNIIEYKYINNNKKLQTKIGNLFDFFLTYDEYNLNLLKYNINSILIFIKQYIDDDEEINGTIIKDKLLNFLNGEFFQFEQTLKLFDN